jgi:predicted GTPase
LKIEHNGKIEINEDALNIIAQYNSPVGFVSLVGKARTGKSCLLNRLLELKGRGVIKHLFSLK